MNIIDREPILGNNRIVTYEIVPLEIELNRHKETIQFDIIYIDNFIYILGML